MSVLSLMICTLAGVTRRLNRGARAPSLLCQSEVIQGARGVVRQRQSFSRGRQRKDVTKGHDHLRLISRQILTTSRETWHVKEHFGSFLAGPTVAFPQESSVSLLAVHRKVEKRVPIGCVPSLPSCLYVGHEYIRQSCVSPLIGSPTAEARGDRESGGPGHRVYASSGSENAKVWGSQAVAAVEASALTGVVKITGGRIRG